MNVKKIMILSALMLSCVFGLVTQQAAAQPGAGMARVIVELSSDSDVERAEIYINGKSRGPVRRGTEVRHVVPFGSGKEARIEVRSGEFSEQKRVVLYANRWTRVTFTLRTIRPGAINVQYSSDSHYPRARMELDGANKGTIRRGESRKLDNLEPGEYTVKLSAANVSMEREISVRSGQTTDVEFNLHPPKGTLTVEYTRDSAYARARIFIDGQNKGNIRLGRNKSFSLSPGEYTVRVESGREAMERTLTIKPGETTEAPFTLKAVGILNVQLKRDSAVRTAELYLNGEHLRQITRGQNYDIRVDGNTSHTIEVRSGDDRMSRRVVTIKTETIPVIFGLY